MPNSESGTARDVYEQVEAATLGGWRSAATRAGIPPPMIAYWQREMTVQTAALRADARRPAPRRRKRP